MKYILCTFIIMLWPFQVKSQMKIDSLAKIYEKLPSDTASIKQIVKTGQSILLTDIKAAKTVFEIAEKKAKDQTQLCKIYLLLGQSNLRLTDDKKASEYYIKAKKIAEKLNDKNLLASIHNGLGNMYLQNKETNAAIENFNKSLKFTEKNDQEMRGAIFGNLGIIYNFLGESEKVKIKKQTLFRKAIGYTKMSYEIAQDLNLERKIVNQGSNLSQFYANLGQMDSASYFIEIAEKAFSNIKDPMMGTSFYFNKGGFLRSRKKYKEAITAYKTSTDYAKTLNMQNMVYENYLALAYVHKDLGNLKESVLYYDKHIELKDSVTNQANFEAAADVQNKYEAQKKEFEIFKLNAESTKKSNLIYLLIGICGGVGVLSFLAFKNYKNAKKVQELKIAELEKTKQLQTADAMLKGQENERNRIAKDLHDGLGGMLSGVKMAFTNIKDNLYMSTENVVVFEKTISQLDKSIDELRKISHNLMPEALARFGLNDALTDYCNAIHQNTKIIVTFEKLGEVRKLSETANIYIYRIIQELINNAVKHAEPQLILVQLTLGSKNVLITVEDDGLGMNQNKVALSDGIGIENIKHRVNYFKGIIHFENKNPNGTVVNIELNI